MTAAAVRFLAARFLAASEKGLAPAPEADKRKLVCYGLNYDVNQWLASVPIAILRELWSSGFAVWRDYQLRWLPGRWFSVKARGRFAKVCEVLGFFQSSFVAALKSFG